MLIHYVSSIESDGIHTYHFELTVRQWVNLNSISTCSVCQHFPTSPVFSMPYLIQFITRVHFASTVYRNYIFFSCGAIAPQWARASSFLRFLDHTLRRNTVGRTALDEWSARIRDLYLTTHNIHNRQISMWTVGFEPAIPASERPQNHALDRTGTGISLYIYIYIYIHTQTYIHTVHNISRFAVTNKDTGYVSNAEC